MIPADSVQALTGIIEPENIDTWPDALATATYLKTVRTLIVRGYMGVKLESGSVADGKCVGVVYVNHNSPEGRLVALLEMLARAGRSIPVSKSIENLERTYKKLEIPLPHEDGSAKC